MTSSVAKRIAGVAQERVLPKLAVQSFQEQRAVQKAIRAKSETQLTDRTVLLWPDTWNNYYHPQTLLAAEKVLIDSGFVVDAPTEHLCCGRPLYDFGFLDHARAYLSRVLDRMAARVERRHAVHFSGAELRERVQG